MRKDQEHVGTSRKDPMRIVTEDLNEGRPEAAVVVPVADVDDLVTRKFLDNLRQRTRAPLRVFLVESSGDEFSYGKSVNAGIRAAEGFDIVVGMDSDAFPEDGAVERLLEYTRSDPRLGYVGAKVLTPGAPSEIGWVHVGMLRFVWNALRAMAPIHALRRLAMGGWWSFGVGAPESFVPGKMVGSITTMFALKRECYDDVGPFDERFRVSYVDVDYNFRILLSERWHVSTCVDSAVLHERHVTRTKRNERIALEGVRQYLENWPRKRIELVLSAAARGKFIIPGQSERR
jgi:GT2 family glycosyltransferase